jgi:hypothetical protein
MILVVARNNDVSAGKVVEWLRRSIPGARAAPVPCVAIVLHFVPLDHANPGATHASFLNVLENDEKVIAQMKRNMNLGAGRLIFDHAVNLRKRPTPAEARL